MTSYLLSSKMTPFIHGASTVFQSYQDDDNEKHCAMVLCLPLKGCLPLGIKLTWPLDHQARAYPTELPGLEVIKLFFRLNSTEHEIFPAHKC